MYRCDDLYIQHNMLYIDPLSRTKTKTCLLILIVTKYFFCLDFSCR